MDDGAFLANVTFCEICDAFLSGRDRDGLSTAATLDSIAKDLAVDESLRVQMGAGNPSIWPRLHQAWGALARQVALDWGDPPIRCLITSFARFTRNLVAAVSSNQRNAFTSEPSLRHILHAYTSWTATQDSQSYPITRMLVQTLSNIVTSNDELLTRLWETYLNLPEERTVFTRLLGSPDTRTTISLLVLLINCIRESGHRQELFVGTQVGARLCIALLDRMAILYDAEESSDEGKAFDHSYILFVHLFDGGFAPKLYAKLRVPDEIIVPHQTTLLKLFDSYLNSSRAVTVLVGMSPMLTASFFELCTFTVQAIKKSIGIDGVAGIDETSSDRGAFDPLLPKVCEALVLVIQCLVNAMLGSEGDCDGMYPKDELSLLVRGAVSPHGKDIAVCAIELLRLLDIFLPRINFGKPVTSSKTIQGVLVATDPTGFSYVKRDLVRLLGVLCHQDRRVQDSIRNCEGIPVIMNMCVVDERNPYLREHAIFALHNLLGDNEENQNVVNNIRPFERWGQDGTLQR